MNTQPILFLREGTLRYPNATDFTWSTCKVFIVDWDGQTATVVLREPADFQNEVIRPVQAGAIRRVMTKGGPSGDYLTVDL